MRGVPYSLCLRPSTVIKGRWLLFGRDVRAVSLTVSPDIDTCGPGGQNCPDGVSLPTESLMILISDANLDFRRP